MPAEAYRVEQGESIGVGYLVERIYHTDCAPCRSLANKVNRLERQITKKYREQARLRQQREKIRAELHKVWDELNRLQNGETIVSRSKAQVQEVIRQLKVGGDPGALADAIKGLKELLKEVFDLQHRINQTWVWTSESAGMVFDRNAPDGASRLGTWPATHGGRITPETSEGA